jgi:RecA-family ATPase
MSLFELQSLSSLLAWKPPIQRWIVENLITREARIELYGEEGTWKSMMSMHLAFCVALGKPWLGHSCIQSRVAVVHVGELAMADYQQRVIEYMRGNKITTTPANLAFHIGYEGSIDNNIGRLAMVEQCLKFQPDLLILDPVFSLMSGDLTSTADMQNFRSAVDLVRSRIHCAVWMVHHERKPSHDESGARIETGTAASLGSRILAAWVDGMIRVEPIADDFRTFAEVKLYYDKQHGGKIRALKYIPQPTICRISRLNLTFNCIK